MGLHKAIPTPDRMYELFRQYKEAAKKRPKKVHDFVGKDAIEVYKEREVPLTYEGFQNYVEDLDIITTLDHYFMNYEKRYEDFVGVCARIKREIRQDQIEGGMVGIYNPSITQRLNNLVEKTDVTSQGEKVESIGLAKLSDDDLAKLAELQTKVRGE